MCVCTHSENLIVASYKLEKVHLIGLIGVKRWMTVVYLGCRSSTHHTCCCSARLQHTGLAHACTTQLALSRRP